MKKLKKIILTIVLIVGFLLIACEPVEGQEVNIPQFILMKSIGIVAVFLCLFFLGAFRQEIYDKLKKLKKHERTN